MTKKSDKSTGISPTTYHSLLKDISQIYEVALSDGNENWNPSPVCIEGFCNTMLYIKNSEARFLSYLK